MLTLSVLCTYLGFWICYQTSGRADLTPPLKWEEWLRADKVRGRSIGLSVMYFGMVFCAVDYGFLAGIFSFLLLVTVVASLVIVLAPLGLLPLKHVSVLFLISLALEILL